MRTLTSLGVGAVSAFLILVVVIGGYNLLALSLGTVTGDYFMGAMAVVVLLGGAWLSMQDLGFIGKPFMVGATLVLIGITVRHRIPGVADYFSQTTKAADRAAHRAAVDLSVPREIRCDRGTPDIIFFDGEHRPLVWLAETKDGRLICYDRPGAHPRTNRALVPVDERFAGLILAQEPPRPAGPPVPEPTVTPPAPPAPSRTAEQIRDIPDLSEGPIPR